MMSEEEILRKVIITAAVTGQHIIISGGADII